MTVIVKSCCGCCGLRVGTQIIGILGLLSSVSMLSGQLFPPEELPEHNVLDTENNRIAGAIGSAVITILVNSLLLFGVTKGRTTFFLPFLIISMMSLIAIGILTLICTAYLPSTWMFLVVFVILFGTELYMWLIVYSYYQELKGMKLNRNYEAPPLYDCYSAEPLSKDRQILFQA